MTGPRMRKSKAKAIPAAASSAPAIVNQALALDAPPTRRQNPASPPIMETAVHVTILMLSALSGAWSIDEHVRTAR
jgi:hypothetical protein